MNQFTAVLQAWETLALWLLFFFAAFGILERLMPMNPPQNHLNRETFLDMIYAFALSVLNRLARIVFIGFFVFLFMHGESSESINAYFASGFGPLGAMPVWLQSAVIFLASDMILYWAHRLFHGRALWDYHAIHHSPEHVEWHSAFRFHPINLWFTSTLLDVIWLFCGFSPAAVSLMATFNLFYSTMVHANVNWTFGPFRYIFASPVFHRWHHTAQEEGMNRNFAPTFPLIDLVFGTFYMPEGRRPERYGVPGTDIPRGFLQQMIWPLRKK